MTILRLDCYWLPASHGGRKHDPHPGLRLGIRWQRYAYEDRDIYRDAEIEQISLDPVSRQGDVTVRLISDVRGDWIRHGELVEILEGFKVVAVGSIVLSNENGVDSLCRRPPSFHR